MASARGRRPLEGRREGRRTRAYLSARPARARSSSALMMGIVDHAASPSIWSRDLTRAVTASAMRDSTAPVSSYLTSRGVGRRRLLLDGWSSSERRRRPLCSVGFLSSRRTTAGVARGRAEPFRLPRNIRAAAAAGTRPPRNVRGGAATSRNIHSGAATSRNIRVAAAAPPRPVSAGPLDGRNSAGPLDGLNAPRGRGCVSFSPIGESPVMYAMPWPPSDVMPASRLTRVRSDGFSKSISSVLRLSASQ